LAKLLEGQEQKTTTGVLMGTPEYMAPEQAEGLSDRVGVHADVYALGVILYELLTDCLPFHGASLLLTLERIRTEEPIPPRRLRPQLPRDLETICLKCLRKAPRDRYATAAELAQDLRRFLAHEPIRARRISVLSRTWAWSRRPERIRDAGVIAILVGLSCIAMETAGLVSIARGTLQPDNPVAAIWHLATMIGFLGLPMLGIGFGTLTGRLPALWAGAVLSPIGALYLVATGYDMIDTGGLVTNRDPTLRLGLATVLLNLLNIQFVTYLVALIAYYSNRHTPGFLQDRSTPVQRL
jgi:hypothetical protein